MRIVIDMQGAQTLSRFRGIGRYTTALVHALLKRIAGAMIFTSCSVRACLTPSRRSWMSSASRCALPIFTFSPSQPAYPPISRSYGWRKRAAELVRDEFLRAAPTGHLF